MSSEIAPLPVPDPTTQLPAVEAAGHLSLRVKLANLAAITIPLLGLVAVPVLIWGRGFHWVDLILLLVMYLITAIGITVGFHRLFTHRSFETSNLIKVLLAILGSMAVQGPLLKWVAVHRRHHQYSDKLEDPHSPSHSGHGVLGVLRGMWHAHLGWMFLPDPANLADYVKDLKKSRALRTVSALFPAWVALGLLVPAVLGGIVAESWMGALTGFIWGGLVRIVFVHHVTWSINSACHIWGRRPFKSDDDSRNNLVFGYLALGEGWHNSHHAFPTSARHGLRWWQFDASYLVIRALALLGLAWDVRVPTPSMQAQKQRAL
jgi:stearoyl-CoA desaturase (delta-9 desaturase)